MHRQLLQSISMTLPLVLVTSVTGLWALPSSQIHAAENLWLDVARASITANELRGHVGVLADDMLEGREAGSRGNRAAAHYILGLLEESGLKPAGSDGRFTQSFQGNYQNLLAMFEGVDPKLKDEYVVVGAHYDHVGYGTRRNSYGPWGYIHNGADDNASGVATLLEIVDALTRTEHRPRRSLLFAFWDGEEKGLLGSKHWIGQPSVPLDAVRVAVNIDMVGRLREGRIEVMGTRTGAGLRQQMSASRLASDAWLDFTWDFKDNSDHWTFYEANIPSLCIHTGLHDDYHRPSDDVEKLNIEGMRSVSRYLFEQLCELADAEQLPNFRSQVRYESPRTQLQVERPLPRLASRLNFTWKYQPGEPAHVIVQQVQQHASSVETGLRAGDIVLAVDGLPIVSESLLPAAALRSEQNLSLEIQRAGEQAPIHVSVPLSGKPIKLGLSWRDDEAEPKAVFVTRVVPHSPAALSGIKLYDRIYALDGKSLEGQDDLFAQVKLRLADHSPEIRLQVESRGIVREVPVLLRLPTISPGDATL